MSAPSYVINWEELLEILGDKLEINIADIDLGDLEDYLKEQFEIVIDLLKQILEPMKDKGIQRIHSISNHIPAVVAPYRFTTTFETDVLVTGVTYSQSAWKYQDNWDLVVDGVVLFEEVGTKEIGESKQMNVFYYVPAGKEIDIILHNDSGNSRLVWFDIEYIDLSINNYIPTPEPDEEETPPIDHDYDWLIVMKWEDNTNTDLDLHCYIDCNANNHVYHSTKELTLSENDRAWLDYDYTSHGAGDRENKPEIITILGMDDHISNIYLTNYNAGTITEDVTIEVYRWQNGKNTKQDTIVISPNNISGEKTLYIGNIKNNAFVRKIQNVLYGKSSIDLGTCEI